MNAVGCIVDAVVIAAVALGVWLGVLEERRKRAESDAALLLVLRHERLTRYGSDDVKPATSRPPGGVE